MDIIFMGTPDFAKESLEAIYNSKHHIVGVVTNPDKQQGRGMNLMPSPVKQFALEKKLKIFQPENIKGNLEFIKEITELKPQIICVVAYGHILPKEILDIPVYGCINVHASLLPKYRGAAPIQWAIINGDKITGVTTMYMDIGMDTGDMILKKEVIIDKDETTGELWGRLSKLGAELLLETVKKIEEGKVVRKKQGDSFTVAPMLKKEIAKIEWERKTGLEIKNLIRGLNPIMGAYSYLDNKKIKFWKVEMILDDEYLNANKEFREYENKFRNLQPGTVVYVDNKKGLYIKAKDSVISVIEIQAENSKKMNILEFLRGNQISAGKIFES